MLTQVVANALIAASGYFLVAVGFGLIYSTARFFHFAHGIVFTAAPYVAFLSYTLLGLPFEASFVVGILTATALGGMMELLCYRPLRSQGASALVLLLASLGIYIVLQNVVSVAFGDDLKNLRSVSVREGLGVFGARLTMLQLVTIGVSVLVGAVLGVTLLTTKAGKIIRAVANDPALANAVGANSGRVLLWTFAAGSAMAGLAGLLLSLDVGMNPTMGMRALLMGVVTVIVGGIGSIRGAALAALLIGLTQNFCVWFISSQWQDAIVFLILLAFLVFRPQGFCGQRVRIASV